MEGVGSYGHDRFGNSDRFQRRHILKSSIRNRRYRFIEFPLAIFAETDQVDAVTITSRFCGLNGDPLICRIFNDIVPGLNMAGVDTPNWGFHIVFQGPIGDINRVVDIKIIELPSIPQQCRRSGRRDIDFLQFAALECTFSYLLQ